MRFAAFCVLICFTVDVSIQQGCSEIPTVENAEVSEALLKDSYSSGDKLEYHCALGYMSRQKTIYECLENEWKKQRGIACLPKRCELPEDIPNGRYVIESGKNFEFASTIKYICKDGFQIVGRKDTRTCRHSGWDGHLPACEEVACLFDHVDRDLAVQGVSDYGEPIRFGVRLTFSCFRKDLMIEGQKQVMCQSDGKWSSPFPKCVVPTCPVNITDQNVTIARIPQAKGPSKPGGRIIFSCTDTRLKLKGKSTIVCQSNGEWSDPFPSCVEKTCEADLRGRRVLAEGHSEKMISAKLLQTVRFTCDGDGDLNGAREITCLFNEEWSDPLPKCIGKCGPPPVFSHADTVDIPKDEYDPGEKVEYQCYSKYIMANSPYMNCTDGEWTGNITCLKPCSVSVQLLEERNLQLLVGGLQKIFAPHNDHITFVCQKPKQFDGKIPPRQKCTNGVMLLPKCV